MDSKLSFFLLIISIFLSSCGCKEDDFGEHLELVIPVNTYPAQDTFLLGDTLWIEANINKHVEVRNAASTIYLDGFNFFTEFLISEISDTVENYIVDIELIEQIGEVEYLPLTTVISYPILYEEQIGIYELKAGIILRTPGLFTLRFGSASILLERYDHPAMFTCKNNHRERVDVIYENESTSLETFEKLFRSTKVDYLLELTDFERYRNGGSVTFFVKE